MTMMTMPTTALLDGDMVAHRTAYITTDIEDLPMVLNQTLRAWTPPGCSHVLVALSDSRSNNYRRTVYTDYKAQRDMLVVDDDLTAKLHYARELLEEDDLHKKYVPTLEADDLMGIACSSGAAVAVTLDKDLLSCPGWHYRPQYSHAGKRDENGKHSKVMHEAVITYQPEWRADELFYTQWLMGDTTDNYPGLPRVGPKTAKKLLRANRRKNWDALVLATYEAKGFDLDYCLAMARCARILRTGEWSREGGVVLYDPF